MFSEKDAINHIVLSAQYWSGDTIDNTYYLNNLEKKRAFKCACKHVKDYHFPTLDEKTIEQARKIFLKKE